MVVADDTAGLTLLEKLVKCHSIWYMPHLSRLAAAHILRSQKPGTFIVRQSSQPNSMALSVRLDERSTCCNQQPDVDVEHFLIERTSNGVRLNGSSTNFPALPVLLAHYFDAGNELPVKLTLPILIMNCFSRKDLCNVASLGKDFWSSSERQILRAAQYDSIKSRNGIPPPVPPNKPTYVNKTVAAFENLRSTYGNSKFFTEETRKDDEPVPCTVLTEKLITRLPERSRTFIARSAAIGPSSNLNSQHCTINHQSKGQPNVPLLPFAHHKRSLSSCSPPKFTKTTTTHDSSSVWYQSADSAPRRIEALKTSLFIKEPRIPRMRPEVIQTEETLSNYDACDVQRNQSDQQTDSPSFDSFKPKSLTRRCITSETTDVSINKSSTVDDLKNCSAADITHRQIENVKDFKPSCHSIVSSAQNSIQREIKAENSVDSNNKNKQRWGHLLKLKKFDAGSKNASKTSIDCAFLSKSLRATKGDDHHRLSAPNLSDKDKTLAQIVQELKQRQRLQNTAENLNQFTAKNKANLHTINEGLTTTPVLRKCNKTKRNNYINDDAVRLSRSADNFKNLNAWKDLSTKEAADFIGDSVSIDNGSLPMNSSALSLDSRNGSANTTDIVKLKSLNMLETLNYGISSSLAYESEYGFISKCAQDCSRNSAVEAGAIDLCRIDSEDSNIGRKLIAGAIKKKNNESNRRSNDSVSSVTSHCGTLFAEPWDSSTWESLLLDVASTQDRQNSLKATQACIRPTVLNMDHATTKQDRSHVLTKEQRDFSPNCSSYKNPLPYLISSSRWEQFSSQVLSSSSCSTLATDSFEKKLANNPTFRDYDVQQLKSLNPNRRAIVFDDNLEDDHEKFSLGPVLTPARFKDRRHRNRNSADPSSKIQQCVERLSCDLSSFFGMEVKNFIDCTLQAKEGDPVVVLGNIRQFMNGIKNYLVKHGERDLHDLIERERSKLRANEFLNIDAILEGVLQKIVLQKLKSHVYHVLIKDSSRNGTLNILSNNFANLKLKNSDEFGLKLYVVETDKLNDKVRSCLRRMQNQFSPLKKLENLLQAMSLAYQSSKKNFVQSTDDPDRFPFIDSPIDVPAGDELLQWFVYVLSRYSVIGCEIECHYIRGLLHPSLLSGEAAYYLAVLSSAVNVLKHPDLLFKKFGTLSSLSSNRCTSRISNDETSDCLVKVAIPNEHNGTITYHSFPLAPQLTVSKFCRLIAHRCNITNPEDYGLYLLLDDYENCLLSSERPYLVNEQLQMTGSSRMFAYKRHDAKIAWPKVAMSPS